MKENKNDKNNFFVCTIKKLNPFLTQQKKNLTNLNVI